MIKIKSNTQSTTQNKDTKNNKKASKDQQDNKVVDDDEEQQGKLVDIKQKDKTVSKIKKDQITVENQWQQHQPEPEIPQQQITQAKPAGKVFNKDVTKTGQQKAGNEGYPVDVNALPSLDQGVKESQQQHKKDKQFDKKPEKKEEKPQQEKKGLFQNSNKKADAPVLAKHHEEQKNHEQLKPHEETKHVTQHPVTSHAGPVSFIHSKKEDNMANKQAAHVPEVKHEQPQPEKHVEPVKVIEAKSNLKFSNSAANEKNQARQQSRSPQQNVTAVNKQKSPPHHNAPVKTVNHQEKVEKTEHVVAAPKHFVNTKKTDEKVVVPAQKQVVQQQNQEAQKQENPKQEQVLNNQHHEGHDDDEWQTVESKSKLSKGKPQHHRNNDKK